MASNPEVLQPITWKVQSVLVKARDGPFRLEQVYRLLLTSRDGQPIDKREAVYASCDLRPGVHGAPRKRSNG